MAFEFTSARTNKHEVNAQAATAFALSTAPGRAGVAVLRVSGPRSRVAVEALAGRRPEPRRAAVRTMRDPSSGVEIDKGFVLWLPGPASFTGEDMAEFHVHGGMAVVQAMLDALASIPGLRLAEPGEFTRRAFENGKLDLSEAEAIDDLVNAETQAQRAQALRQAAGALRDQAERWRAELISAMALVESGLDFADEADIPAETLSLARPIVAALLLDLDQALADSRRGEILRDGVRVAIVGAPNAGKSSLLNALVRREAAIVSAEPGTTRDVIEVKLDLEGFPFILSDTAGLRDTDGAVEREGIRRALALAESADLVLHLHDLSVRGPRLALAIPPAKVIEVGAKADLVPPEAGDLLRISALTGEGLDRLQSALLARARETTGMGEPALITRARHRTDIAAAASALRAFLDDPEKDPELLAEDIRAAAHSLGRLTGHVDVEDVLGKLFSDFCIGK